MLSIHIHTLDIQLIQYIDINTHWQLSSTKLFKRSASITTQSYRRRFDIQLIQLIQYIDISRASIRYFHAQYEIPCMKFTLQCSVHHQLLQILFIWAMPIIMIACNRTHLIKMASLNKRLKYHSLIAPYKFKLDICYN